MTEEAKEARRRYLREWRKNNPEKFKAQQERYWAKKAKELESKEREKQGEG